MSKPWYDLATEKLGPSDSIQKTYSCSYDKTNGYLCLTKEKLVFVNVKGFLKKSYDVALEVPYTDLKEVKLDSRYMFNLVHQDGESLIETSDLSAKTVLNAIKETVTQSPTGADVVFLE
jgi:outer membrane cobalamin receptor